MAFEFDESNQSGVIIKVVGVGGAGNNAINRMVRADIKGVELIAINTDKQVLIKSLASNKIAIGEKLTKGHGAGSNPEIGRKAAEESTDEITAVLKGADMVFVTAGMGGGTGTGAAPVIARIAKSLGILTVAVVTRPFHFEGKKRADMAEGGINDLLGIVDSLIIIPNEKLKLLSDQKIAATRIFELADDILCTGVSSISDIIVNSGFINVDFADVTTIMANAGIAHMGLGRGKGKDKVETAVRMAVSSPLLETSIAGANSLLLNVKIPPNMDFNAIMEANELIYKETNPDVTLISGLSYDESLDDEIEISVIATNFNNNGRAAISDGRNAATPPSGKPDAPKPEDKPVKEEPDQVEGEIDDIIALLDRSKRNKGNNNFYN